MENEPQSMAEIIPRILETQVRQNPSAQSPKPFDVEKRRRWLDKWLRLKSTHSSHLVALENSVYQFCSEYAKRPASGRRLVIHGANGTGKSHTLKAVHAWATRLAINLPCVPGDEGFRLSSSLFLHWPQTVHKLQNREYWVTDAALEADLLLIDDIGAEHDPSKFGCEQLYIILERREYKWTMITTNATPEIWEDKFERRISSRLIRNTEIISTEEVPDWNSLQ